MTFYNDAAVRVPRPDRIRLNHDLFILGRDLLPLFDFTSTLAAAYLSVYVYAHLIVHQHEAMELWRLNLSSVMIASLLAPLLLRDRLMDPALGRQTIAGLIGPFVFRFLAFSGCILAIAFATRSLDDLPRVVVTSWLALSFAMTLACRLLLALSVRVLQARGLLTEAIAIVGAGPVADRLIRHLIDTRANGIELLGVFDERRHQRDGVCFGSAGTIADLVELGQRRSIDWILVTLPSTAEHQMLPLLETLKTLAVRVGLCPQHIGLKVPYRDIDYLGNGLPVTVLADRPLKRWKAVIKDAEDFLLGGAITLCALPVLALIALAIKLDSPGPVIFKQRRHTSNNLEFDVFKFRTMYWDPAAPASELKQTRHKDARVTRVGRFLRSSSLDELPQLFNVLRGEMSLVGPRPHAVNMRTEQRSGRDIIASYPHRHRVKPGMTGWSQVNGSRGATETIEQLRRRIELDLYYVEHWSLALDLRILLMTSWVVLRATNAR